MDKTPFDLAHWKSVASQDFPNGIPDARTSDPTQIYFSGNLRDARSPLHVAVARLVGYRWPRQTGYPLLEGSQECTDGLEDHEARDGIVCLPPVHGHPPGADRLVRILQDAYGSEWSASKLNSLLTPCGFGESTLSDWLQNRFFKQHCTNFRQRPFGWRIWDGRRDGFSALVNYHRLAAPSGDGRRTLENLTYAYLGDWIDRQRRDQQEGFEGADARVAAAGQLRKILERILEGEPPYDVFVRWKSLSNQSAGWEPDIEDGVRVNIRPFLVRSNGTSSSNVLLRVRPGSIGRKALEKELEGRKKNFRNYPGLIGPSVCM